MRSDIEVTGPLALQIEPITVAAQSKVWNDLAHSNTEIVGSNPIQDMDICVRLFCLCFPV
jgi:hypothetical protein